MASNAVNLSLPNPQRIRVWVNRLPFLTRIILLAILLSWLAGLILPWFIEAGALIPSQVSIFAGMILLLVELYVETNKLLAYRLNTFPIVHAGTLCTFVSLLPLVPLLERFESQYGTLVTGALFFGPFSTFPGVLYVLIDHVIFRADTPIQGSAVWIYLLLASEALILHRRHPSFKLGDVNLPIWPFPIPVLVFLHFLLPSAILRDSLLGNLCGCGIGYLFELGYLKFLVPPEKILRYIEGKLNLLGRLPHYVSVDQKVYGRYGSVLPMDEDDGGRGFRRSGERRGTPVLSMVNGTLTAAR